MSAPSPSRGPGRPWPWTLSLALIVALAGGCGRLTSPGYSVSGSVTRQGRPLDQGSIVFVPEAGQGEGQPPMVGGEIRDGRYALPNPPGVVPGRYRVRINSRSGVEERAGGPPDMHLADPRSKEQIPEQYNEKTTLRAEVTGGSTTTFDFDLK